MATRPSWPDDDDDVLRGRTGSGRGRPARRRPARQSAGMRGGRPRRAARACAASRCVHLVEVSPARRRGRSRPAPRCRAGRRASSQLGGGGGTHDDPAAPPRRHAAGSGRRSAGPSTGASRSGVMPRCSMCGQVRGQLAERRCASRTSPGRRRTRPGVRSAVGVASRPIGRARPRPGPAATRWCGRGLAPRLAMPAGGRRILGLPARRSRPPGADQLLLAAGQLDLVGQLVLGRSPPRARPPGRAARRSALSASCWMRSRVRCLQGPLDVGLGRTATEAHADRRAMPRSVSRSSAASRPGDPVARARRESAVRAVDQVDGRRAGPRDGCRGRRRGAVRRPARGAARATPRSAGVDTEKSTRVAASVRLERTR